MKVTQGKLEGLPDILPTWQRKKPRLEQQARKAERLLCGSPLSVSALPILTKREEA